ncbi:MAG: trigger factor [Actinobacteria bacterium RBG_16_64_13]|nr:MAG: trigger factor [Actinobacteria bacterium RBG_16_64_13]
MKTTLSERDGNTVKLAVEVSTDELQEAFDDRLKHLSREVRIPGFRPGKAPVSMVRQRLGDETILVDAIEESMGGWFAQGAAELELEPVDRPQIDLETEMPELDKPLSFMATVTVMPELVLGEYKGVEAQKDPSEATDEEVDAQVDRLRNELAELRPVTERAAQMGDFVTADFHATLEGKAVEGLEATDFAFELGGNRMFSAIEGQLVGMNPGEEKTFPFELPEGFPDEMGGKSVDFTIALKEVKEKVLPGVSDQWASEVSEFATLLELRQEIRNRIGVAKAQSSDQLFRARAIKAAADNATIDLPDVVVREQAEELFADFARSIESQGGSIEGYAEVSGISVEQIIEDMKPTAANNVKTGLVLDAVAKAESVAATDEEVDAVIVQMAAVGKVDAKSFENRLRKTGRIQALRDQIVRDKAAEFIVTNAVAVQKAPKASTRKPSGPGPSATAASEPEASEPTTPEDA